MRADDIESVYPLAPMQAAMIAHARYAPGSPVNFQQLRGTIDEPLDVRAFAAAWQWVVDRHPTFRTGFIAERLERPVQVVHRAARLPVAEEDWRHLSACDQSARLDAYLAADRARGLNLSVPPLMRLLLARRTEATYWFVWTYHHVLLDGWSLAQTLAEVFAAYTALLAGATPVLPPAAPYRDFVLWLRRQDQTAAKTCYRRALAGVARPTRLVFDAGPAQADAATGFGELEATVGDDFRAAARRLGLTPNTLVQGAWATVLRRYGGGDDVLFLTTVTGRAPSFAASDRIVGLLMNNVPVRVRFSANDGSCASFLRTLQERSAALRQHEHLPADEMRALCDLAPCERLADTLVVFENYPLDRALNGMIAAARVRDVAGTIRTGYALTLVAMLDGAALRLLLVHERARFGAECARWLLDRVREVLLAFTSDAARPLADLTADLPAAPAALRPRPAPAALAVPAEPRTAAERDLIAFLHSYTRAAGIGLRSNLLVLAGHSLGLVAMIHAVEARYGVNVPLALLAENPTVERLCAVIAREPLASSLIVRLNAVANGRPFFCIHPSGGEVFCYAALAQRLGRPFFALQATATATEGGDAATIESFASTYVAAIRAVAPQGPYLLGGWSFGGSIAYEIARQLRHDGESIALLALLDSRPREAYGLTAAQLDDGPRFAAAFLRIIALAGVTAGEPPVRMISNASDPVEAALAWCEAQGMSRPGFDRSHARAYFARWRTHFRALHNYDPQAVEDVPITLFTAREAPPAELTDLLGLDARRERALTGWGRRTSAPFDAVDVPGNHYNMVYEPHVDELARVMGERLDRAAAG